MLPRKSEWEQGLPIGLSTAILQNPKVFTFPRKKKGLATMTRMAPKRVNRAHGPTKENRQNFDIFCIFRPTQKIGPDGPKWGQEDFSLLIQTLPTFWAEPILILRIFIFWIFWGPKFLAWAHLGPTWAQLGPCLLYTSPSPRDRQKSRMPSSA